MAHEGGVNPSSSLRRLIQNRPAGPRFRPATTQGRNAAFRTGTGAGRSVQLPAAPCATTIPACLAHGLPMPRCGATVVARRSRQRSACSGNSIRYGEPHHASCQPARQSASEHRPLHLRPQRRQRAVPLHGACRSCATRGKVHARVGAAAVAVTQSAGGTHRHRALAVPCLRHLCAAELSHRPLLKPLLSVPRPNGFSQRKRRLSCNN